MIHKEGIVLNKNRIVCWFSALLWIMSLALPVGAETLLPVTEPSDAVLRSPASSDNITVIIAVLAISAVAMIGLLVLSVLDRRKRK